MKSYIKNSTSNVKTDRTLSIFNCGELNEAKYAAVLANKLLVDENHIGLAAEALKNNEIALVYKFNHQDLVRGSLLERQYWIEKCEMEIDRLLDLYRSQFPKNAELVKRPKITYDLKGKSAGLAMMPSYRIRFNPILLIENGDDFIRATVGHELAHLIAAVVHKKMDHGVFWKKVMGSLGLKPNIYHNYDIASVYKPRKIRVAHYKCPCCRTIYHLSLKRHKSVIQGITKISCPKEKAEVEFIKIGLKDE